MWVIFLGISPGSSRLSGGGRVTHDASIRPVPDPPSSSRWRRATGVAGEPLLDEYLRFLAGRCRPNTVLAAAYDLKVFFTVVGKHAEDVRSADVLAFVTAQRTGRPSIGGVLRVVDDRAGVSLSTVRRRLSSVSGLFAFLQARGDVSANPVPRGLPTRRERQRPHQGVPLVRRVRTLPRILSPAEVDALTAALRTLWVPNIRFAGGGIVSRMSWWPCRCCTGHCVACLS
jgi:Phage integrase, N-terminal SAM-like domain